MEPSKHPDEPNMVRLILLLTALIFAVWLCSCKKEQQPQTPPSTPQSPVIAYKQVKYKATAGGIDITLDYLELGTLKHFNSTSSTIWEYTFNAPVGTILYIDCTSNPNLQFNKVETFIDGQTSKIVQGYGLQSLKDTVK